jgi:SecY translocase
MPLSQRTPPFPHEFMLRFAVTLAALAVYRLGAYLPLPGMNRTGLASLYQSSGSAFATERISVVALGVAPIVSALLLVEVIRLLSRRFNAWAGATTDNARQLERSVFIGAPVLAAVQAYGVAVALEGVSDLVTEPGLTFRLTVVATLVAGTAVLMWLATVISRHGLGSGVWLLLLAPHLAGLPPLIIAILETLRTGAMSAAVPVAVLAYALAAVAVLVALGLTLERLGRPLDRTLIWPPVIAFVPAGVLNSASWLLPAGSLRDGLAALQNPEAPIHLAAVAAIVVAVSLAQWRRAEPQRALAGSSPPFEAAGTSPRLLTALALAAIAVVPWILTSRDVPILVDSLVLTALVAVALPIVAMLRRGPA